MTSEVMYKHQAQVIIGQQGKSRCLHMPSKELDRKNSLTTAGSLIREWRTTRRLSQLDLALEAQVSPRHLSCLETGRSNPSREMILRLADVLDVPLRERNTMLLAGGFAPMYRESNLNSVELEPVRKAVEYLINQHEPYPAFVMTRYWDVVLVNNSAKQLLALLRKGRSGHSNVVLQVFDPGDLRPCIANWNEVAGFLLHHLYQDISAMPSDRRLKDLLEKVLDFPDAHTCWAKRSLSSSPLPLLTTNFRNAKTELRFFSTISTLGTTNDITLEELRIECLFPADDLTTAFFSQGTTN